jgi:SAM-dependent methyltransferase
MVDSRVRTLAAMPASGDLCPACGGELSAWRSVPTSEPTLGELRVTLLRCGRCGTAVTVGGEAPGLHDTGAYGPGAPRLARLAAPLLRSFDRRRLAMLAPLVPPPARLLDVGAGRGRFVATARAAGYAACGIEPSARGAAAAAAIGAPVRRVTIGAADLAAQAYDAITVWHVLEHLDDPGAALERIGGWLRPGGALLVGVPNLASAQARVGGPRWYHLDVPRHRLHFTLAGISALLGRHGYEIVRTHHILAEQNPFGMWQSLVNRLTVHPSYLYNLLKRNAPARSRDLPITALCLPLLPVAALAELAAGAAGAGGTVAILARRAARSRAAVPRTEELARAGESGAVP